jgi:hypothetical protein
MMTVNTKKRPNFDMANKRLMGLLKNGLKILILLLILLSASPTMGQPKTQRKIQRMVEMQERKERKEYEKRRKEAVKHRYSIQSEEVQERMKESWKKADRFNKGKREPFYKKWCKKNKRNRKRKHKPPR